MKVLSYLKEAKYRKGAIMILFNMIQVNLFKLETLHCCLNPCENEEAALQQGIKGSLC